MPSRKSNLLVYNEQLSETENNYKVLCLNFFGRCCLLLKCIKNIKNSRAFTGEYYKRVPDSELFSKKRKPGRKFNLLVYCEQVREEIRKK